MYIQVYRGYTTTLKKETKTENGIQAGSHSIFPTLSHSGYRWINSLTQALWPFTLPAVS